MECWRCRPQDGELSGWSAGGVDPKVVNSVGGVLEVDIRECNTFAGLCVTDRW